jgi:hypothetical protein
MKIMQWGTLRCFIFSIFRLILIFFGSFNSIFLNFWHNQHLNIKQIGIYLFIYGYGRNGKGNMLKWYSLWAYKSNRCSIHKQNECFIYNFVSIRDWPQNHNHSNPSQWVKKGWFLPSIINILSGNQNQLVMTKSHMKDCMACLINPN